MQMTSSTPYSRRNQIRGAIHCGVRCESVGLVVEFVEAAVVARMKEPYVDGLMFREFEQPTVRKGCMKPAAKSPFRMSRANE